MSHGGASAADESDVTEPSTFVLFGTPHRAAIPGALGIAARLPWLGRRLGEDRYVRSIGIALGPGPGYVLALEVLAVLSFLLFAPRNHPVPAGSR